MTYSLLNGDCLEVLKNFEANSVDSIVTDPPAGILFMGKDWDGDKGGAEQWIRWLQSVMAECLRVLKPGGHAFVWALPRTSHWTGMALERAGFEVRDCITHHFGSGFPKSLDVSKAIDKAAGVEGPIVGKNPAYRERQLEHDAKWDTAMRPEHKRGPGSDAAKQWSGFGTALKPATEFYWLVRKPLSEKTVAANVLKWGTGGINIDASRIQSTNLVPDAQAPIVEKANTLGRFPANLILSHSPGCELVGSKKAGSGSGVSRSDERTVVKAVETWECVEGCAVAELDRQSGTSKSTQGKSAGGKTFHGADYINTERISIGDSGGASRFFYIAKASRSERNAGLEGLPERKCGMMEDDNYPIKTGSGNLRDTRRQNHHPTVKSLRLMAYLIRMITPPGGLVLDPFAGSGTTGVAAKESGFDFIGIERESEYCAIAEKRIEGAQVG